MTSPVRAAWIREAVAAHQRPLTRYAERITGDLERARDVVQETFLRLCREDPAELQARLPAWLYTVCRRRALDVRRKEKRMQPASDGPIEALSSPDSGPEATVEQREAVSKALRLLSTLPEKQREALRLKFQGGLSYREIGEVVGTSIGNVGSLIHMALRTLRRDLAPELAGNKRST